MVRAGLIRAGLIRAGLIRASILYKEDLRRLPKFFESYLRPTRGREGPSEGEELDPAAWKGLPAPPQGSRGSPNGRGNRKRE